jgi:hypothetical protein
VYRALAARGNAEPPARTLEAIERRLQTTPDDARALCFRAANLFETGQREKGMAQMDWIKHDTDLDPLRDDPRFKALLPAT